MVCVFVIGKAGLFLVRALVQLLALVLVFELALVLVRRWD